MSQYLDCELRLTDRDQASLTVSGRDYAGRPILDETLQQRLRALEDPKEYGRELFAALFSLEGDLLSGYRQALAAAQDTRKRLRFRLHIASNAPADLHELRWELLYDRNKSVALGCSRELTFSRYSTVSEPLGAPVQEKPRLLVAIACPSDQARYRLPEIDRESTRRSLEKALAPLAGLMSWEILPAPVTAASLSDRLAEGGFHALHLQAHGMLRSGRRSASIALENEDGTLDFVDEEDFSTVFEGNWNLRLVTLMTCHSGTQSSDDPFSGLGPALVRRGIPAVVAMRQSISLSTAGRFCEHFYRNLARSGCVDKAINEARLQLHLSLRDSADWGTPILFMRLQDGLLWKSTPQEPAPVLPLQPQDKTLNWQAVIDCIGDDKLLPFLGPDVCRGMLPSRAEVAERWFRLYPGLPLDRNADLPSVAQFVEAREGTCRPHDLLLRILAEDLPRREGIESPERLRGRTLSEVISAVADHHFAAQGEDEPHHILAGLSLSTFVTTSPDSFLVEALRRRGKSPLRQVCLWREEMRNPTTLERYKALRGTPREPLVFHIYGNDEDATSLVLTEDNHLDWLRAIAGDPTLLTVQLHTSLTTSMLLFLGFDLRRLDSRVLLRALLAERKKGGRDRYAVLQIDPDEKDALRMGELRTFLESCCQELLIRVYWGSARSFLVELRDRWKEAGRG